MFFKNYYQKCIQTQTQNNMHTDYNVVCVVTVRVGDNHLDKDSYLC